MKYMITLYIVRHGETEENAAGILQGRIQGHLSEKGKEQAQNMKTEIAQSIHPDRLIASDLQRTVDTAQILNEAFHLPLETNALLRERDWGEYTGRRIATLPKGAFPKSVETIAEMMERANRFLVQLVEEAKERPSQHVLIVSHGVFSRCIQAAATHQTIHDIPILRNLEMRVVDLPSDFVPATPSAEATEYDSGNSLAHGKES